MSPVIEVNALEISVPELNLHYELSRHPIQALGSIAGREFFFIAKHGQWDFEMANDLNELPSDVSGIPVFRVQSACSFAESLEDGQILDILKCCAQTYLATRRK